jgi:hypothetical protein
MSIPYVRMTPAGTQLEIFPGILTETLQVSNLLPLASAEYLVRDGAGLVGVSSGPTGGGNVVGPVGATDNAVARYNGTTGNLIQNSTVLIDDSGNVTGVTSLNGAPIGNVNGPAGATDNAVARYDGTTGKLIQNGVVTIGDTGAIAGASTLNGSAIPASIGDVAGPAGATSTAIALYNGTTGKVIGNSTVLIDGSGNVTGVTSVNGSPVGNVVGPASATDNAVARYDGTTGKLTQNGVVTIGDTGAIAGALTLNGSAIPATIGDVTGPASATSTAIALYNGTTGKVIENSTVLVDGSGNLTGVTSVNGSPVGNVVGPASATDNAVARYDGTTGKLIQNGVVTIGDTGAIAGALTLNGSAIPATLGDVTGPTGATSTAIALYNGTTGKVIGNSTVLVDGSGNLTGVTSVNGSPVGNVVGPASTTDNAVARYDGTTGKLIQNGVVTIGDTGAIAGALTLNGSAIPATIGDVTGPAGATSTAIARYSDTTGKLIGNSTILVDGSGNITGVTTINGSPPSTSGAYAEFYALMPGDNGATIAAGSAILFPQNGETSGTGVTRVGTSSSFQLASIGTYAVTWQASVAEPAQVLLYVDSGAVAGQEAGPPPVKIPRTVVGRASGTSQISGSVFIRTTATNTAISVRNGASAAALTLTPIAGGTDPVSANINIRQIA